MSVVFDVDIYGSFYNLVGKLYLVPLSQPNVLKIIVPFLRFNADLMNPNNREGRYHWALERLEFVSDGKGGRKLGISECLLDS